jgi:hypothetical protein
MQEYRSQMSLFAVLAAPLIFSADIRGTQNGTYVGHNGVHHSTFNGCKSTFCAYEVCVAAL